MDGETSAQDPGDGQGIALHRSTIYSLFILALIVFSWMVMAGVLVAPDTDQVIWWVDFGVCAVLFADFLRNLRRAPSRTDYFFRMGGWLDLLGSIPAVPGLPLTSLFHLARLNQVVRIIRHLRAKDREEMIEETRKAPAKTALLTITIAAFVLITVASLLILRFEQGAPGASIQTGADALWWAMVTITTIGYGDYVPVTLLGRIVAMVVMTFGIGVFAVLTSFAATRLIGVRYYGHQDDWEEVIETIREETAIIRAELAELKDLLKQQATMGDDEV